MNFENFLYSYLIEENSTYLESLISNTAFYNLIMKFLKRNGIYRDRFPKEDFPSALFIALKEARAELLITFHNSPYKTVSRLANVILKHLNRDIYRNTKLSKNEIKNGELLENLFEESEERVDIEILEKLIESKDSLDQLVLSLYFGLHRDYLLNIDDICKIVKVKRSSTFNKVKIFKKELRGKYGTDY